MEQQQKVYCSVTKIANKVKEINENAKQLRLYFDSTEMFKNKFDSLVIKPVLLAYDGPLDLAAERHIPTEKKSETIKHEELLQLFDGKQLMVSFKPSPNRQMIKNNHGYYYLNIDLTENEYKGIKYYPAKILGPVSAMKASKIRSQTVTLSSIPEEAF